MTEFEANPEPGTRNPEPVVYVVVGVTASGKTSVAVALARALGAELASLDSMKVYRGLDIGTAKPTPDERAGLRWHLLDLVEPTANFNVGSWLAAADEVIADCTRRGVALVFEGGSPLYYRALTEGLFDGPAADEGLRAELEAVATEHGTERLHAELTAVDPVAAERIEPRDLRRIVRALEVYRVTGRPISELQRQFGERRSGFDFRVAGVRREREELYSRIDARVDAMMAAGLLQEVRALREHYGEMSRSALQALGYRELGAHLDGEFDLDEAIRLTKRNTRHFARRQINWFKKFPGIEWFDPGENETGDQLAARIADSLGLGAC
jgi:tRNA dimethylallyltransferase